MSSLQLRSNPLDSVAFASKSDVESSDCSEDGTESCQGTPRSIRCSLSIPSTPELPAREPSPACPDAAVNFFHHRFLAESPLTSSEVTPMIPAPPPMRASYSWYCVAFISGIDIRADPNVDGRP